jgi:hypothetical protein
VVGHLLRAAIDLTPYSVFLWIISGAKYYRPNLAFPIELVYEDLLEISNALSSEGKSSYGVFIPEIVRIALKLSSLAAETWITHTPQNASRERLNPIPLADFWKPAVAFPTLTTFPLPLLLELLERRAIEICSVEVGGPETISFSR